MKRVAGVIALAVLALLLATATASAGRQQGAREFVLDSNPEAGLPAVAIDSSSGTAHIVWKESQLAQPGDILHYCRVPRNGRSCEHALAFTVPPFPQVSATDFAGPKVFSPGPGQVVIATSRCCMTDGNRVFVFTSNDGGTSFSGPVEIGTIDLDSARLGPGPFSLSGTAEVTGGTYFQAMPLAGPLITEQVNLGVIDNTVGAAFYGSIAFADPFTPIVAMSDLDRVYFRRYLGGTAYNDIASWGPLTPVGEGSQAKLAGLLNGKGGIHLMMSVHKDAGRHSPAGTAYVSRRYNAATCQMPSGTGCFEPPVTVSEIGDPIFREFFADPSGRQHALWVDNGDDSLKYRRSLQGEKWDEIETLLAKGKAGDVYNISSDAAGDGGGFAAYDANGNGPVRAVQYGPKGPVTGGGGTGGGECVDQATVGLVVAVAQDGCLLHKGDTYTTADDVRINGIDILVGDSTLTIDAGERTLKTAGKVESRIGNVILGQQELQWRLPQATGQIRDLAGNPAEFHTGAFGVELLGLDVLGYTVPEVVELGKVAVPVNLELPQPFSSALGDDVTGGIVLHASNEGVELGTLDVQVTDVSLGIARIKDFTLHYASGPPELLQGDTEIAIPPTYETPSIEAGFGLRDGAFDYANGGIEFGDNQLLVATDVFLKRIYFAVQAAQSCDVPTTISGEVTFTTGPELAGASLIEVVGGASFALPQGKCGTPGKFAITGAGKVAGLQVVTLSTSFTTDLQFEFSTEIDIDVEAARVYIKQLGRPRRVRMLRGRPGSGP